MNGQDSQIAYHRSLKEQASANACAFVFNKDKYTANEAVYLQGLYDIATKGRVKYSRPGQATLSLSGTQQRFDLTDGKIPLLGSKEIFHRSFLIENQWFLSGDDDIKFLKDRNVSIWDSWVIPETAVFEPTEKQTGSDVETYMRCYAPTFYKDVYIPWKRNNGLAFPTAIQIKEFFDKWMDDNRGADFQGELHAFATRPVVKLVAGKIGAGAYGPAWRKWDDVRIRMDRPVGSEHKALLARGFKSLSEAALIDDSDPMAWGDIYSRVIDQFGDAIKMLRTGADSRRIIVSAWNAAKIDEAALPPCHSFIQFVSYDNFDGGPRDLVCNLYMR